VGGRAIGLGTTINYRTKCLCVLKIVVKIKEHKQTSITKENPSLPAETAFMRASGTPRSSAAKSLTGFLAQPRPGATPYCTRHGYTTTLPEIQVV
jgi:hypothetical protein